MINVLVKSKEFENDIHSIVKAFYPDEKVVVTDSADGLDPADDLIKIDFPDDLTESKSKLRSVLKRRIYDMLSKSLGKELPWGSLTGVRPSALCVKAYEEGKTDEEVFSYMKDSFAVSDKKLGLATDIAKREIKLLNTIDFKNEVSVYVGIPFCPTTCAYCSFASNPVAGNEENIEKYLYALFHELEFAKEYLNGKAPTSIYIGGGTPTSLNENQLERLLGRISEVVNLKPVKELTIEAGRPDSITREKLKLIKDFGFNRISVNPQTLQQKTLDIIGRKHTVEQFFDAFYMAREMGFDNINTDLILGLPGETLEDVKDTASKIKELNPESLTVHSLAMKRTSRLNLESESFSDYEINNSETHQQVFEDLAAELGLNPYYMYRQKNMAGSLENTGYAKEGKECIYNILMMEEKQSIIAFGAGNISKRVFYYNPGEAKTTHDIERAANVKDLQEYLNRVDEMVERKRKLFCN
ncbi:MAG: coproporphyrinogen dehydrogenase HemZ [Lachnospiraceae bacterium]|nr:coproporphyrinogen dehydrogenase HemZ [Lachnospiraceae bacterium]